MAKKNVLPKWAEKYFSLKCTERGAVCSSPDEDVNGWDFLIEFPEENYSGPEESRPPIRTAYAQIKSSINEAMSVSIKLSNMLKACQSTDPWFVFLVTKSTDRNEIVIYGVHVFDEIITKCLGEIRGAAIRGDKLHKKLVRINFSDHVIPSADVVPWMRSFMGDSQMEYSQRKYQISKNCGYERGHGTGHIVFQDAAEDDVLDSFLGIGSGITASSFTYTPARFGIADKSPLIDLKDGKVFITPEPRGECEVKVRGPVTQPSIVLPGLIYPLPLPDLPLNKQRVRFSAPPLDVVWKFDDDVKINIKIDSSQRLKLPYLRNFAQILEWISEGPITIDVSAQRMEFLKGTAKLDSIDVGDLLLIAKTLNNVAGDESPNISVSMDDMRIAGAEFSCFYKVMADRSFRIDFAKTDIMSLGKKVDFIIYYAETCIGDWKLEVIAQRCVANDTTVGALRKITAMAPIFLEKRIYNKKLIQSYAIEDMFHNIAELFPNESEVISLGNIIQFIRNGAPEEI